MLQGGIIILLVSAPWALGGAEPLFEFLLLAGLVVLTSLAIGLAVLEGGLRWSHCSFFYALAALCLLCLAGLARWPDAWLSRISPATAGLYDQLLPHRQEVLLTGDPAGLLSPRPGTTLSLYPHATRLALARLLALLVFYYLVRNYAASPAFFRVASVALVLNGVCLALFALLQWLTADAGMVYWTIPTPSQPFGPFVCKNHFPFYLNVCIGLAVGLALYEGSQRSTHSPLPSEMGKRISQSWLANPRFLGAVASAAFMSAAVALSLSRGGVLALAAASLVALVILFRRSTRWWVLQLASIVAVAAFALVAWLGSERVERRMSTLYTGQAFEESRLPLWTRSLRLVGQFPVWGTGLGTYQFVEPLTRHEASDANIAFDHAHNDYLEALVEGGVPRLVLSLLLIALVYYLGGRALKMHAGRPIATLTLGALMGLTSMVIHSLGDFGLHLPAIAMLGAALVAQLSALAQASQTSPSRRLATPESAALHPRRLAPAMSVICALLLSGASAVLCKNAWRQQAAKSLEGRADVLESAQDDASRREYLSALQLAASLVPTDALLQMRLAQFHLNYFEANLQQQTDESDAATNQPMRQSTDEEAARFVEEHLLPGLQHLVQARDLCPLLPEAQMFLAFNAQRFRLADAEEVYLARAKRLLPGDPAAWYLFGQHELAAGRYEAAWQTWRYSLQLSDAYLGPILDQASRELQPADLLRHVLPARPAILLRAALHHYPASDEEPAKGLNEKERLQFLGTALQQLEKSSQPLQEEDLYTKACVLRELGRYGEAIAAYRTALQASPQRAEWRCELAALLLHEGSLQQAEQELRHVLARQPHHARATELLKQLSEASPAKEPTTGAP